MNKILVKTLDGRNPIIFQTRDTLDLFYPCQNLTDCTPYNFNLTSGIYIFEAYGASGGFKEDTSSKRINMSACIPQKDVTKFRGNAKCDPYLSAGAGGYISGVMKLKEETEIFATVGGSGFFVERADVKGGYNGGGGGSYYSVNASSSGGGASDIRIGVNDLWHRVLVAGGGGGHDDSDGHGQFNDGGGGCGGYPNGQGYWLDEVYNGVKIATQEYGFSFGQGESSHLLTTPHVNSTTTECNFDCAGAGGGWFGGHASRSINGGAGGGSSFALTKGAIIPKGEIEAFDVLHVSKGKHEYAFANDCKYCLEDIQYANGIWAGNGFIRITKIPIVNGFMTCTQRSYSLRVESTFCILLGLNV